MIVRVSCLGALALLLALAGGAAAQPIAAELTPLTDRTAVAADTEARVALRVTLPRAFHVNANQPRDPSLIPVVLTVTPPAGVSIAELVYPDPYDLDQIGSPEPLLVYGHEFVIGVVLAIGRDVSPGDLVIGGSLRYQACDDRVCYFPQTAETAWTLPVGDAGDALNAAIFDAIRFGTGIAPPALPAPALPPMAPGAPADASALMAQLDGFAIQSSTGGYLGAEDFLTFIGNAEAGVQERGLLEGRGVAAMLLVVLLGGLALNLTPCVLPMIPINLAIIGAGTTAGSRRRGFLLGSAYGAAMAVVYGALGLIVILTAGTFGTINASPWFNTAIAVLFIALGLAMFDVFHIDFSRFSTRFQMGGQNRGSFLLAFGMGGVAALLAGACVAPVVIQVVLFSSDMYAGGTAAALALPFLLGVGMAIPWPIAGAGISALPKPGPWMVRVKQAFGVAILATAAYYGYLGYTLFADRWVDPEAVSASVERMIEEGWQPSLAAGLAEAQAQGKPVLVDMWATWCKNCLTMDATTLSDAAVTGALEDYVKVKFQAESPDQSPAREVMQRFGAIGLPTYVILQPAP
jgi:cytochrome c biogenesis protein CcdA/thiol-disulfide isomerase/thioredoxin/DsbC/DsbD-like thiol-disulfide interchange protein